jgi:flavin-dependent dehydrogenase
MERCDVLVVGGGPAGSSCALELRRHGLDVTVLDQSRFPRDKICAGWITPQIVATLGLDLADYARSRVLQPLHGFSSGMVGGRSVAVRYGQVISYGIRRCEFDDYLLRRSGARLRLAEAFESAEFSGGEWCVNGAIRARYLVGAGGHFCPVARLLGAELGRGERAIAAQEIEVELSERQLRACRVEASQAELYFCADLEGYGWCVRKGNFLNVGLGRTDSHQLGAAVNSFWDWLRSDGRIPSDLTPRFKGHAYLQYGVSRRPLLGEQALLIGDAAGLAYDLSGEGIRPAVESGLLAAQSIARAAGGAGKPALAGYAMRITQRFGRRAAARAPAPLRPVTPRPASVPARWRSALARLLVSNGPFARHVILDRNFLHRHTAALLPAAIAAGDGRA